MKAEKVKTYRVYFAACEWTDTRCNEQAYQTVCWDGMKAGPFCFYHARYFAAQLEANGFRRDAQ